MKINKKKILFLFVLLPYFSFSQTITLNNIELILVRAEINVRYEGSTDNGIDAEPSMLESYYIGKYEITNSMFAEFLNSNKRNKVRRGKYAGEKLIKKNKHFGLFLENGKWQYKEKYKNHPVINVTWYGANEYCEWLSRQTGEEFSLPTKNQWIYAASGGKSTSSNLKYSGTKSNLKPYGNYIKNSFNKPKAVGSKLPNEIGIYDMSGNVKEWCYSYEWQETTEEWVNEDDGMGGTSSEYKNVTHYYNNAALRGGGWADTKKLCKITKALSQNMSYKAKDAGFRVCMKLR